MTRFVLDLNTYGDLGRFPAMARKLKVEYPGASRTHHVTGSAACPIERTLLTTGLVAEGAQSLAEGQRRIQTPHLAVRYRAPRESSYLRS